MELALFSITPYAAYNAPFETYVVVAETKEEAQELVKTYLVSNQGLLSVTKADVTTKGVKFHTFYDNSGH